MKRIAFAALVGLFLTACGGDNSQKMGEKAGEGSTGEREGYKPDTTSSSTQQSGDTTAQNKSNY